MLNQRALTAIVLAPIAIAIILFLPTAAVGVIIAAVCLQALWEWMRLAGLVSIPLRGALTVFNAILLALLWSVRDSSIAWVVIGVGVAWWVVALLWMRNFSFGAAPTRENTAIKWLAGVLAVLPAWLALVKIHANPVHGHAWALFAMILIWVADTAAYFTGKRYGTTKLAPRISPNKTTAGAWGALICAGTLGVVAGWLLDTRGWALVALAALALLTVAASIAGDLFESLMKRQANVKDSGTLFPGHGGLLDRADSLFAAVPVFAAGKALLALLFAQ